MLHCVYVHVCTCRATVKIDSDVDSEDGFIDSKEGLLDLTVKVMDKSKSPIKYVTLHLLCSHHTCTDLYPYALINALVLLNYRVKPDLQSKTSHLHSIRELSVFAQPSNLLTTEKAIGVLLFSGLTEESICSRLPVSVDINAVFVVDLN